VGTIGSRGGIATLYCMWVTGDEFAQMRTARKTYNVKKLNFLIISSNSYILIAYNIFFATNSCHKLETAREF
jgi:hypothetical protein